MGVLLLLLHLAWMRAAQLLFALFEWPTVPSWDRFIGPRLAFGAQPAVPRRRRGAAAPCWRAWPSPSAHSRCPICSTGAHANLFEAIATSVAAVRLNIRPMVLWAGLIVVLVALAMVPGLLGLVVVLPVVGHATWHAYRDIVRFEPASAA